MKKLIALLAFVPALAFAEPTYRTPNNNGGEIVLTMRQCTHKEGKALKHGYTYARGGKTTSLCWYLDDSDNMVKVIYLDDFTTYTYPASSFKKVGQ
jgi:hypothetical protein